MNKLLTLNLLVLSFSLKAQEKQNALLIILDDMNDYIGVMGGHPQAITPNIDRLAEDGVIFSNAHSNAPICAPSRASFLSGIYPSTSGNFGFEYIENNVVLTNSKFIMEYAAENGFETYSTGKVFHRSVDDKSVIKGKKQDQGPTAWDGTNAIAHPSVHEPFRNVGVLNGSFAPLSDVPPGGWRNSYDGGSAFKYVSESNRDKMCDELSADYICQWVDEQEALLIKGEAKPFFMAYGGMKPHTPHVAPKRFFDMFPLDKVMIPEILKSDLNDAYMENLNIAGFNDYDSLLVSYSGPDEGLRRYVQSKLACIAFADSLVGVIVEKIRQSPFADNTVIILCGDNGYHMGEKQRLAKNTLWEESTHIPLIISAPGYNASEGAEVTHPVGLIDIYPTFADLCGMSGDTKKNAQGADIDGFSLRAFLEDPNTNIWEGPDVALESVINPLSPEIGMQNYAVRSENYRYIHYSSGDEELYANSTDENEWRNLIFDPNYAAIAQELRNKLKSLVPEVSFEKTNTISYLFFDDFESYNEGDDLLSEGYSYKPDEIITITAVSENENKFARSISVDGSQIQLRKKVKDLTPGKLYFFEAKTRTESSVTAGSWEAVTPNTISGLVCTDWKTFSVPLIPNADSWTKGETMNLFISSAQYKPLDVDSIRFYAASIEIEKPENFHVNALKLNEEYQFKASAIPESEAFSWSVINGTGSASIDQIGKLTTLSEGTVQLIATMDNYASVNCTKEVVIWAGDVNPTLTIADLEEPLYIGEPYQLSAIISPDYDADILWSVDDDSKAIINQTSGFLLPKSVGSIMVKAELYDNNKVFATKEIIIDEANAIKNIKSSPYKIYPNPSDGIFYIEGAQEPFNYKVYNTKGELVKSSNENTINISHCNKGVYFVVIGKKSIEKIVFR